MLTHAFFKKVLPSQGWYCIVILTPRKDGSGKVSWVHIVFRTTDEAAAFATAKGVTQNVYFACLSLNEPYVISEAKRKAQEASGWTNPTGKSYRTHDNMAWARCYFMDVDIGDTKRYLNRKDAKEGLVKFLNATGLPVPSVVSSGNGLHLYWALTDDVATENWLPYAKKLKQLAAHHGFHIDPTRTADVASILRVPGTKHLKDPTHPLNVEVLYEAPTIEFDALGGLIDHAMQIVPDGQVINAARIIQDISSDERSVEVADLHKACAQVAYLIDNAGDPAIATEPAWYKLLGIVRFVVNGREVAHTISKAYPNYSRDETDQKLDQLERKTTDKKPIGPTTCSALAEQCGEARCVGCSFRPHNKNGKSSPLVAARRFPRDNLKGIPPPPEPYVRVKEGIMIGGDKPHIICPYDLYPVIAYDDDVNEKRSTRWELIRPRTGPHQFVITSEEMQDLNRLGTLLANHGCLVQYEELKRVKEYMIAYIRELQKYVAEEQQHSALGWAKDYTVFVLTDQMITLTGSKPSVVTHQVKAALSSVHRAGTLEAQMNAMKFYADPVFVKHQFLILCSLASVVFYMTGHHGMIVNMVGESGSSKSTALYTGASFWGNGEELTLNGTNSGSTVNARNNRAAMYKDIPFTIDEITNMDIQNASDMSMNSTQKQAGKFRSERDGSERKQPVKTKSNIIVCTSNRSLHEMLSLNNATGTASLMRVFEIVTSRVIRPGLSIYQAKREADEFLRVIRGNYGHIGPEFIRMIINDLKTLGDAIVQEMQRLDRICNLGGTERFWSAIAAVVLCVSRETYRTGLLPFAPDVIERWLLTTQMPMLNGSVEMNHSNPIDTLMAYLASTSSSMMAVRSGGSEIVVSGRQPWGEWAGRHETDTRTMILFQSHFKAWAGRNRLPFNTLVRDLENLGLISKQRRNPGAGTDRSIGQTPCIVIDLKHSLISGHERIVEVESDNIIEMKRMEK